jgi:hypothetical protein
MARIKTYQQDFNVTDYDKLLGSDSTGATRNYTTKNIADYLNNFSKIGIGGQISYRFSSTIAPRSAGTLTFPNGGGDDTGFSLVTSIVLSKYNTGNIDVSQYLEYLEERTIFLFQLNNPNYFAEYRFNSITQNVNDANFFDVSLTFINGNGAFDNNEYYGVAASANIVGDKTYRHIQGVSSNTWTVNHGLNKYPSVSVQDSAGTTVIGDITYNDKNTITLTFSGAFSGEAHFN